ncbi:MAG: cell surface protein SprA [Ignavibacteriaceae bacterium]|nr:cell surface protein SprA [Ignavibacteriaceae bacterium]
MNRELWIVAFQNYFNEYDKARSEYLSRLPDSYSLPVKEQSPNEKEIVEDQIIPLNDLKFSEQYNDTIPDADSTTIDSTLSDSLYSFTDEPIDTIPVDSLKIDSTARVTHFKTQRSDVPYTSIYTPKGSAWYAKPTNIKKVYEIDSTGKYVTIKEMIGNEIVKIILSMPIEDYLRLRLGAKENESWQELAYRYELKSTTKELSEFLKDITDFEIPLPSVGFLSIFGPPVISLKISGAVDIHAAWRNETTEGITASRLGNTRNEPDFRQQVQINVNGTIGDKLQISADWNTERNFEYENQLKIKYTGYEDEIIQSIEAGNVSLQTSSLVGGSEALFGVKANFKFGPFTLTTLLSQKKAEVKEKAVESGSTSQDFSKRAYEYSTNHFFLNEVYADTSAQLNLFFKYFGNPTPVIDRRYYVKDIEVWKSINQTLKDPTERDANVFIDLPPRFENQVYPDSLRSTEVEELPGVQVKGRFLRMQRDVDYTLHPETGFISFKTNIQDFDIIAVSYRIENGNDGNPADDLFYGEFLDAGAAADTSRRLILKLVKPANLQPQLTKAWKLLLKNIYPIGGRNIKEEGFEFDIKYEVDGGDPQSVLGDVRLLQAFGLDQVGPSKVPPPDGKFDYKPQLTIFPETGEIIFPYLEPFGRNIPPSLPNADSLRYLAVYDQSVTFARQDRIKDKFVLTGKFSGEASSVYQLSFNMVENSVKVILNGRELTPGTDYVVDYNIGQLTIRNPAALVPGANLRITYEENDLFQLASKTLFGARGILDLGKRTKLGFSALTLSQQTLSDKVRIGEEPLSNFILGVDFTTGHDLPFLTKAIDQVFSTKEMSTFTFSGEFAYMSPDPNTKKSTIESDNGRSIAYIDDFEGAKRTIPVGISYGSWKDLSGPDSVRSMSGLTRQQRMNFKAKSFWFNVLPSDVLVNNIWPERRVARGDEQVTVLDFVYIPDSPGTYNYTPNFTDPTKSWGGMMKVLSSTASNLVDENIEFIEFWLNIRTMPENTKLYMDMGKISEDVIPNNRLDTEDKFPQNDLIDEGEDTGMDGLFDPEERQVFNSNRPDPSNDNFAFINSPVFDLFNYYYINGTEGNAQLTDIGRIPDTEDLNRNGALDQANSYYRYEIPIDTNTQTNPFIVGGGNNDGWYLYRVPLKDYVLEVGSPSFTLIEFFRLFVTGVDKMVALRFADFNLVGNQWRKAIDNDTVLSVTVVNIEDNPGYTSPPGVQRERDRSRPDQEIFRNEQSLDLIISGLQPGDTREAVKYLFRPLDVFNYSEMKLFVHGDSLQIPGSVSYEPSPGEYSAEVFFRFGIDTNNYYEYRKPVTPGWNEISILFSELTAIKQTRDSVNQTYRYPVPGKPGHFYVVKGNATLTSIKFLSVGITNINPNYAVSGNVWVNELRVIGADDTPGWAYTASTSIKFADILTVNANLSQTDPYFHRLNDRFGSRVESRNWGISTDLDVLKVLPFKMPGSNFRVNYSHTESVGNPLYLPGTDIKVQEAAAQLRAKMLAEGASEAEAALAVEQTITDAQSMNISDTWTFANIQLKIPVDFWLIRDTFNNLTYNFNYNKTFSRNPTTLASRNWIWNASINYAYNFSAENYIEPGKIPYIGEPILIFDDYKEARINYTPQTFNWNITARRSFNFNQTRQQGLNLSQTTESRDFTANRGFSFNWRITEKAFLNVSANYSMDIASSLTHLETDPFNQPRPESLIWSDIFGGEFFGRDFRFNQSLDIRTAPRLPSLWDLNKFFQITAGYNVRYSWNNDFRQPEVGRSAGYNNRFTFGLKLRLKALTAPLFAESQPTTTPKQTETQQPRRQRDFDTENQEEKKEGEEAVTQPEVVASDEPVEDKPSALTNVLGLLKSVINIVLFDYENISFDFSNDNTVSNSGIAGYGNGFKNFWGFNQSFSEGPSRLYMLGLSQDVGARARNGNLTDNFNERNSIDIRTSKPLWEGARIEINWKVGWNTNKSTSLTSDEDGNLFVSNISSTGTTTRSFMTLPPVFIFSIFKNGIARVNELYNPESTEDSKGLNEAFVQGFETLPWLSSLGPFAEITNYIPRPNWRITWDGLEKLGIFQGFARRVSLDHSYSSEYTEGWKITPDGEKVLQSQKISYGFSPLVGMNMTFVDVFGGNLTGNLRFSTKTSYDLGLSTQNITENSSREIGITLNFTKSGFEVPLFGVSLKNDIEFSFSYSNSKNSSVIFDMTRYTDSGTPQNGTNTVTIEPRIKYVISSRVTVSLFYKRVDTTPEGASM